MNIYRQPTNYRQSTDTAGSTVIPTAPIYEGALGDGKAETSGAITGCNCYGCTERREAEAATQAIEAALAHTAQLDATKGTEATP